MTDILDYLNRGVTPEDHVKTKMLRTKATRYTIMVGDLYR